MHLKKNDSSILSLLSSQNNELFLGYFKSGLSGLIEKEIGALNMRNANALPRDFLIDHICSVFVETVRWWVKGSLKESPEQICEYFYKAIGRE